MKQNVVSLKKLYSVSQD